MENERDFPEQDGLQENEEDELSQDNLRDGFGEENTSFLKVQRFLLEEVKCGRKCLLKEGEQEIEFLKVVKMCYQKVKFHLVFQVIRRLDTVITYCWVKIKNIIR